MRRESLAAAKAATLTRSTQTAALAAGRQHRIGRSAVACAPWPVLISTATACVVASALWPVLLPAAVACLWPSRCGQCSFLQLWPVFGLRALASAAACCGHCCRLRAVANPMLPPCGHCCCLRAAVSVAVFAAASLSAHLSTVLYCYTQ